MTSQVVPIGLGQLLLVLVFVLLAGGASLVHSLNLERDLLVGTVRTFAQLFLLGYALKYIFRIDHPALILGVFGIMILFAAFTVRGRVRERRISFFWPLLGSMTLSYLVVALVVTDLVIGVTPWWNPRFFLPIGGMVIGNSMNAIALALDRLLGELRKRRDEVEVMLCLGADYKEASQEMVRAAMRAGMIPSINSMMAAGIVFIPGMMTGQILAGVDPLQAIRYQVAVMVMLVGSTTLGSLLVVLLVRRLCFGSGHQPLLRPDR